MLPVTRQTGALRCAEGLGRPPTLRMTAGWRGARRRWSRLADAQELSRADSPVPVACARLPRRLHINASSSEQHQQAAERLRLDRSSTATLRLRSTTSSQTSASSTAAVSAASDCADAHPSLTHPAPCGQVADAPGPDRRRRRGQRRERSTMRYRLAGSSGGDRSSRAGVPQRCESSDPVGSTPGWRSDDPGDGFPSRAEGARGAARPRLLHRPAHSRVAAGLCPAHHRDDGTRPGRRAW
jgi:hypothetical protein